MGYSIEMKKGNSKEFINSMLENFKELPVDELITLMHKYFHFTEDKSEFFLLHNEYYEADGCQDWAFSHEIETKYGYEDVCSVVDKLLEELD